FHRIESRWARLIERGQFCVELRLAKAKIAKIALDGFRKFRCRLCPKFAQSFAATVQVSACDFDFAGQSLKLGVASFDFSHAFSRAFSKSNDLGDRAAIFAL